ncbi:MULTISPECIES: methyl-accepting chemotaxis protein [Enterobacteriaceae]|uniref:methyl-accepting chemotaxis protein n=3 Tax=Enterobacterales TaxID=91347 RepID=UPI000689511B|nr:MULTISPECIES: methyl-accepting chemotaxis protein [Enterobacteriaceae]MDM3373397.1 methyl-accepting chemotaxis protein [Citrobacter sp. Cb010]MDM3456527.1 methyl-accepting chemotaxis protein [Citrobacter sp. Cb036]
MNISSIVSSGIENLKISRKLLLSYMLLIIITFFIYAIASHGLESISNNNIRQNKTSEISKLLDNLKFYNVNFRYTKSIEYAELQKKGLDTLIEQVRLLEVDKRDNASRKINQQLNIASAEYKKISDDFVGSIETGRVIELNMQKSAIFDVGEQLTNISRSAGFDVGLGEFSSYINLKLKDLRFRIADLVASKNEESFVKIENALKDIIKESDNYNSGSMNSSQELIAELKKNADVMIDNAHDFRKNSILQNELFEKLNQGSNETYAAMELLLKHQNMQTKNVIDNAKTIMLVASVSGSIIALCIAYFMTRHISKPLNETLNISSRIASGDLSASVISTRKDEFGELLVSIGMMNDRLKHIIDEVKVGVDNVSKASAEISLGNSDLSIRTDQQSSALVQTNNNIKQLSDAMKNNAQNAEYASIRTNAASANAENGGLIVKNVIIKMKTISENSSKISDITNVINGIAFQTNILALNAAVEAARAGEHGKGFAVVAGEVRTLAQRSAIAAKEIENLLSDAVLNIKDGVSLVTQSGETMEQIVSSVHQVNLIIEDIARVSEKQSKWLSDVHDAVSKMDITTKQNASLVKESAIASTSLAEQARQLNTLISVFS